MLMARLLSQEVSLQRKLESAHVVRVKEFLVTPNNFYVFMEFCEGGSLKELLVREKRLSEQRAKMVMK